MSDSNSQKQIEDCEMETEWPDFDFPLTPELAKVKLFDTCDKEKPESDQTEDNAPNEHTSVQPLIDHQVPGPSRLCRVAVKRPSSDENEGSSKLFKRIRRAGAPTARKIATGKYNGNNAEYFQIGPNQEPASPVMTTLLNSFKIKDRHELLEKATIKWVKDILSNKPENSIVPLLIATVDRGINLDKSKSASRQKCPSVTLRSGEDNVVAALTPTVIEKYGNDLKPGACIILRQCGLLRMNRNFYLTVRNSNFVGLATADLCSNITRIQNATIQPAVLIENGVRLVKAWDDQKWIQDLTNVLDEINKITEIATWKRARINSVESFSSYDESLLMDDDSDYLLSMIDDFDYHSDDEF